MTKTKHKNKNIDKDQKKLSTSPKSNKKLLKVDRQTNIAEIVFDYPKVAEVMLAYGLHCVGCFASQFDNIEQGAQIHGMDAEEVDEMIAEINLVLSGKEYIDE